MEKIMNKLVRDKIPEICLANGDIPVSHVLNEEEYLKSLKDKMMEEYKEILGATTKEEALEECADLMELLFAYTTALGFKESELLDARARKREKRGGFEKRIYLEKTIIE